MPPVFISAVILFSGDPKRLSKFYADVFGLPLEEEEHGGPLHYGCELGDVHFAIHPSPSVSSGASGRFKLAFAVESLDLQLQVAARMGLEYEYEPEDFGFAKMTALKDPDGNYIELTELSDTWFDHLERRRVRNPDILSVWRERGRSHNG